MSDETYGPAADDESRRGNEFPGSFDEGPGQRRGIPWERRDELGPGVAVLQSIRQVVFSPAATFADMKLEGGWAEPAAFAVLVGSIFLWIAQAWDMLTRSLLVGMPGFDMQEIAAANAAEIWFALMAPVLVLISTFFGAAVVHVLLMMFGGAPRPYEATFRVVCYSWAVGVFNVLPICGIFIGAVWRIVVQIIGIREAQQVPTGRAAAAVLVPVVVACFCLVLVTIAALSVAGLSQMGMP